MVAGAVVALVVALAACSAEPEIEVDLPPQSETAFPEALDVQLEDAVTNAMTSSGASGAIVGVWAPWSGSWVAGLGTQYPGSDEAVDASMSFRVAQLTRPMTCDVLYAVAADGTVRLDDPVKTYVSGVADLTDVTLEQLCDGTSGIGSYSTQLRSLWESNPARAWDPRELASFGLGQKRDTSPGATYRSSDAGYVLLGLALERATGMSAAALIDRYVAAPLGLTNTYLPTRAAAAPAKTTTPLSGLLSNAVEGGFDCVAPRDMTESSASIGFTDSGVVSTLEDARRYVQALASGASTPEGAADERFDDAKPQYDGAPSWYTTSGGALLPGSLIGQSGSTLGYATSAYSDPSSGLTVVVVLNNSAQGSGIVTALALELAALASKAPAVSGESAPEAGLPWTPEQYHESIAAAAKCVAPAAAEG